MPITLGCSNTVEEYDNLLYMLDYAYRTTPTFIEPFHNYAARKVMVAGVNLCDFFEFPMDTLLRQGAIHAGVVTNNNEFCGQLVQTARTSTTQSIKKDANRELLARFCKGLTSKLDSVPAVFDHNLQTAQASKQFFKQHAYYDEIFIALNQVLRDLIDPKYPVDAATKDVDLEIINGFLAKPVFAIRLFDDVADAKKLIGDLLDYQATSFGKTLKLDERTLKQIEDRAAALKNLSFFTKMEPALEQKSIETLRASIQQL